MSIGYTCPHCHRRYALDGETPTEWRPGYCSAICAWRAGVYKTDWVRIPWEYDPVKEVNNGAV